jgi:peptidoglycan hydrolase-like protein with peptidoglycan-binding domain
MRYRPIFLLVAIALSVAACGGGGGEGAGTTDIFDTGTFGVGPVETAPPPPAETTQEPQPAIQITVPKGEPIGPQSPAEQVAQVQKALTALGFKIGKPDGIYGEKTRKAVVRFQKNHKLDTDGLVGAKTAKAMNKELAKQASG